MTNSVTWDELAGARYERVYGTLAMVAAGPMPEGWAIGPNETVWKDNALMGRLLSVTIETGSVTGYVIRYLPRGADE